MPNILYRYLTGSLAGEPQGCRFFGLFYLLTEGSAWKGGIPFVQRPACFRAIRMERLCGERTIRKRPGRGGDHTKGKVRKGGIPFVQRSACLRAIRMERLRGGRTIRKRQRRGGSHTKGQARKGGIPFVWRSACLRAIRMERLCGGRTMRKCRGGAETIRRVRPGKVGYPLYGDQLA